MFIKSLIFSFLLTTISALGHAESPCQLAEIGNITHYDAKIKIDIKRKAIDADFKMDYQHEGAATDSLQIFLNNSFSIEKLRASHLARFDVNASAISEKVNAITLHFDRNISTGNRIPIQIKYARHLRQEYMPFAVDNI